MRNSLDPKNFKPQPLRYTGKWNTSNGLHGKKALRKAAVNKAAKEKFKAEKAVKEVPAPATTAVA